MDLSGIYLSSKRRDGLLNYLILEQDQVVTISPLCGIFAKVHVLVQSDYRQVSVMTSLGKEIVDSRVLGRGRHQVVQDYIMFRIRESKKSPRCPDPSGCLDEILLVGIRSFG